MGKVKKAQKTLFDFEKKDVTIDEKPYSTPGNWVWTTLSNLTTDETLNDGDWVLSKDMVSSGPVKLIQLGCVGNCEYIDKGFKYLTKRRFEELKGKQICSGYLLINRLIGDSMLTCIIPEMDGIFITAVDICWIAPNDELYNLKYLMYLLANGYFQKKVKSLGRGTTRFRISKMNLISIPIPLPPLPEQARIVSLIESLFSRLDQARAKAREVIDGFELWKSAILHKAFTGRLVEQRPEEGTGEELFREIQAEKQRLVKEGKIKKEKALPEIKEDEIPFEIPEGWKWVRMSEALDVRDGTHDTPQYSEIGIPLVTSKNLVKGCIDFGTTKNISQKDADMINARSFVDDGDVLYAMIGSIGNPVLVKKDREFCIKNMALFKPLCKDLFLMKYLFFFLEKQQEDMKKRASGGLQPFVSLKFLRSYLCPLAPTNEQKRIVATIESLLSRMDKAVDKAKAVVEQIDSIKKSILEKAFRGELGTNDPTEESALALLKSAE